MITISTKTVLKTLQGEAYKDGDKDMTFGSCVGNILAQAKSTDPWKSFKLAHAFILDQVELTPEDIVFVKDILKTTELPPQIIGQIFELLEGTKDKKEKLAE